MQSNGLLQVDNSQRTVELLAQLVALQIGNSSNQSAVQATSFTPSSPSILINTLWYLTLVLSLASALFGMMAKQWLREYMQWTTMSTLPVNAVFLRQLRYQTFVDWKTPGILACIPVLLEVAVVLFSVGMVIHLFTLNAIVAGVSTVAVAIMLALTFLSLILPVSFPRCPYKSSAGWSLVLLARSCASLWSMLMSRMSLISEAGSNSGIGSSGALAQPPVKDWRTRDLELHPRDGFEGEISQLYNHIVPPHAPDAPDAPDMLQFSREATRIYALSCALLWIQETSQDGQLLATVDDCYKMRNLPTLQADISGDELMVDFLFVCDRLYVPVKAMHAYLHAMYRADFAMNPPADFLVTQDSSPPCDVEAKIFGNPMMIRAVLGNILSGTVLQSLSRPSPRTSNGLGRTNTLVVNSLLLCGHIISPRADLSAQTQIVRRTCMDNFQNIFGLLSKNKGLCQKLPGVRSILFHFMFEWKERRVTSLGQRFGMFQLPTDWCHSDEMQDNRADTMSLRPLPVKYLLATHANGAMMIVISLFVFPVSRSRRHGPGTSLVYQNYWTI